MAKDPQSLAKGSASVAASSYGNQVLYNPALLSLPDRAKGRFWSFPSPAVRIADPDNLSKALDDFTAEKYFENFNTALAKFNQSSTLLELDQSRQQVVLTGNSLIDNLAVLSDKAIELQGSIIAFVTDTDRRLPMAFTIDVWGSFGIVGEVSDSDLQQMRETLGAVEKLDILGIRIPDPTTDFISNVQGRGIMLQEIALTFSHRMRISQSSIYYGVTPKYVRVNTYDYYFAAADIDTAKLSLNTGLRRSQNFNMDVGLAMKFAKQWQFAIKNIIEQEYSTILGNVIDLKPAARIGLAYSGDNHVISMDYDLLRQQALGIGGASQYLSVGYEYQWRIVDLRTGYRHNITNNDVGAIGLGVDWQFWHAQLGLAVQGNMNEISAATQLSLDY